MNRVIASTYEIIDNIGAGGIGTVYLARHRNLDIKVVLKAEKEEGTKTKEETLRREADILKNLNNPYIPRIYDYLREDGYVYTVMEYIEGESMNKPLDRGEVIPSPLIVKWAIQLLKALDYLHSPIHGDPPRGYIHSDIKPANIMVKPNGDICLIDFNISRAIGELGIRGLTRGYASPEHYGWRYTYNGKTARSTTSRRSGSGSRRGSDSSDRYSYESDKDKVVPDERSDIYSIGATLYHMMSGVVPQSNALGVVTLVGRGYDEQISRIIGKAMDPDPDLRYQSAKEMLQAFLSLKKNDPENRRLKAAGVLSGILTALLLAAGAASTFVGLKRMQTREEWLKLTEYSQNAYKEGDVKAALQYALDAVPARKSLLTPDIQNDAQLALTKASGVYDLSDGYHVDRLAELPSELLQADVSPDGRHAACVCLGELVILDLQTGEAVQNLEMVSSALAEAEFVDNNTIIYAAADGISVFDLSAGTQKWAGQKATGIALSGDKKVAAAVYKDESKCVIYDVQSGQELRTIDLEGHYQPVLVNDIGYNPGDNMLVLNEDGTKLGISLDSGMIRIYDLRDESRNMEMYDDGARFSHFEGGFYRNYFMFAAGDEGSAELMVLNTDTQSMVYNSADFGKFRIRPDGDGFWVSRDNRVFRFVTERQQMEQLFSAESLIEDFCREGDTTIIVTKKGIEAYDGSGIPMSQVETRQAAEVFAAGGSKIVLGNTNSDIVQILTDADHSDAVCASYDPGDRHIETRISADGKYTVLFSIDRISSYRKNGDLLTSLQLPDPDQIYDQQFRRENGNSLLEVTYYDGTVRVYDAVAGKLLDTQQKEKPDATLREALETEHYRIESPLHGSPVVYDKASGKQIAEIREDAYLSYADEAEGHLFLRYITTDLEQYTCLMDDKCRVLARMPRLCDIYEGELYFDYLDGTVRKTKIYGLDELRDLAEKMLKGTP